MTTNKTRARRANQTSRLTSIAHDLLVDTAARSSEDEIRFQLAKLDGQYHGASIKRRRYLMDVRVVLTGELARRAA